MLHRPRRALGQNFLVDRGFRARIVEEAPVEPGGVVLEIGPGRGALTEGLVRRTEAAGGRLVLVELDDDLAADLAETYREHPCVEVVHGDVLARSLSDLAGPPEALAVIGNIPYNLTSPILFHLLRSPRPREILLMVQAEVADRILAGPGTRAYGALTVGVRSVAGVEKVLHVPAGAFRPRPKVDSTVIRIRPFRPPPLSPPEEVRLRDLTRAVFQWRRKQMGKILREHPDLELSPPESERALAAAGVAPTARPEEVSPTGFVEMAKSLPAPAAWRKVSEPAVRRLSLYLRALEEIGDEGAETASSRVLAERAGTTATQVRKDLSLFGSFGKRGLGYAVHPLRNQLRGILGLTRRWQVALVGAGHIGAALAEYRSFKDRGFEIVAILDNDPAKIGSRWNGIEIQSADRMVDVLRHGPVDIAILAVPAEAAQEAADALVAAGVRGILNFAPVRLRVPKRVVVNDVDMTLELESLSFALRAGGPGREDVPW